MKKTLPIFAAAALLFGFSSSAVALSINDAGIVGVVEGSITGTNATNEAQVGTNILSMGINETKLTTDAFFAIRPNLECDGGNLNQVPCEYHTGDNPYSSTTLGGGVQVTGNTTVLTAAALASQYIIAKYDGPNVGYVLFNVADWLAAGNTALPGNGSGILNWGNQGISHYTYFGTSSVPDGGITITLLGSALVGLGLLRRKLGA